MQSARGRGRSRGRAARPAQSEESLEQEASRPGPPAAVVSSQPELAELQPQQSVAGGGRTAYRGPPTRPGDPQTEQMVAQAAAAAAAAGGGRAAHRGQGEPRPGVAPGADVAGLERGVEGLRVGAGGAAVGPLARRRGALLFISEPHTRPSHIEDKKGTSGSAISLVSNLFKLNRTTNFHIFQYRVSFNPEVPSMGMRKSMLKEHTDLMGSIYMFDGETLFLPIRLEKEITEIFSVRRTDDSRVQLTVRFTAEVPPSSPTCLQLYNIVFKRILTQNDMRAIGRNYYNPKDAVDIPQHGLQVWPGFATSILPFETSVMLIADVSHKILSGQSVLDIMYQIYNACRGGPNFKELVAKKIIGQIVLTRYNNKTYRIDDIDWNQNPTCTFKKGTTDVSFAEYYKQAYAIEIKDAKQPLLLSMPKAKDRRRGQEGPLCILPEICSLTGLSDEVRQDFQIMKDLAVHTRIGPGDRVRRLQSFIGTIGSNPQSVQEMKNWNLEFAQNLLQLPGRVLPTEKITQANPNAGYTYNKDTADWSREMRNQQLLKPAHLTNWVLMFSPRDQNSASDLSMTLMKVCPPMGMQINKPVLVQMQDDSNNTYLRALRECVQPGVCMVVCILPTNRKDRYDAIKTYTCIENPVPSQMILGRTLNKKQMLMSVATKVAIQLNCKMGGEVWVLDIPLKFVMIVGIDTYHDSAKKGRSVGAFVASMNNTFTRYYSRCAFQSSHEELQNALRVCMQAALREYHKVNGALPEKIIVFRDGVGDGQLAAVHEHEVKQLLESFAGIGEDYKPKCAIVVVKKRINSRFFMADRNVSNPPPGTVIDSEATRPEWYDFFVISQSVRQGTVSPTHYNVIHDTTGLRPDHMQRLTYKLCHLYYNWPGTIRVPAPCQYAHKMAFLVGQSLHKDPSLLLADKLFYL